MIDIEPIIVRGGGDLATGIIYSLYTAGFPIIICEIDKPTTIRRYVSFSEAVYKNKFLVENVECIFCNTFEEAYKKAKLGKLVIIIDPTLKLLKKYYPKILIDAIIAKKNIGTNINMAELVIGIGPGFNASVDVDYCVETMRGHNLGRIIKKGYCLPNTNTPGIICGVGIERVIHSPGTGKIEVIKNITSIVKKGDIVAKIHDIKSFKIIDVKTSISGVIRGMIKNGFYVKKGLKIADVDPRLNERNNCYTISDKARCIGGSVLNIICKHIFKKVI